MKALRVNVIIFDWSGTLSDDIDAVYDTAMKVREHYGLSVVPKPEWRKKTMANAIDFLRASGVDDDDDTILGLFSKYFSESAYKPTAFDDADGILSLLYSQGKTIVIVSGHPQHHLDEEVSSYRLGKYITKAYGTAKNKTEKLRLVADEFDVGLSDTVYIGDMTHDVRAAKEAGVHSIAIARGPKGYHDEDRLRAERADFVINSLEELKGIIV